MNCPTHGPMSAAQTQYGVRWHCEAQGCSVACWSGSTSTPATAHVRSLRHKCHLRFDPLWKNKTRFQSRGQAYKWLAQLMGLKEAHIGQFDADQCRTLLVVIDDRTAARHGFNSPASFDMHGGEA